MHTFLLSTVALLLCAPSLMTVAASRAGDIDVPNDGASVRSRLSAPGPSFWPFGSVTYIGPIAGGISPYNPEFAVAPFGAGGASRVDDSDGTSYYVGLGIECPFGRRRRGLSLLMRFAYERRPSTFDGLGLAASATDAAGNKLLAPTHYHGELDLTLATGDLLLNLDLGQSPLSIAVGPSFGYVIDARREERLTLDVEPADVRFAQSESREFRDDGRTLVLAGGAIPDLAGHRIGIKAGLRLRILLFRSLTVTPSLWYDHGLTAVSRSDPWRSSALQFGIDIQRPFNF